MAEIAESYKILALVIVAVILVAAAAFFLWKFHNGFPKSTKVLTRGLVLGEEGAKRLAGTLLVYTMLGLCQGALLYLLLILLGTPLPPIFLVVMANGIAWILGFVAVFAPSGLGIREGVLAVLLEPWLGLEAGFMVAATWRFVQIFAEGLCFFVAWLQPSIVLSPKSRMMS